MSNLLVVNASVRIDRSLTRDLSSSFVEHWKRLDPDAQIVLRDVGLTPPPHIDADWIASSFTPASERSAQQISALAVSDELLAEIEAADVIVIATPMYNYGMPAVLKAWIDQVVRVNRLFSFDLSRGDEPIAPILKGKSLVLLTSNGEFGFEAGGHRETWNHLDPHIRTLAPYFGANIIHHVQINYQEFGDARHEASVKAAQERIPELVSLVLARREVVA